MTHMGNGVVCYLLLALLGQVNAARVKEAAVSMQETDELFGTARTRCSSARCNGASDGGTHQIELNFRYPTASGRSNMSGEYVTFRTMSSSEVASQKGYDNYHHGSLYDCSPIKNHFELANRDWPTHMQNNMRAGLWPNQPLHAYSCVERCKLKTFSKDGQQLNKDLEPVVWVQRDGHKNDPLARWKPPSCTVGTLVQEHWWKQASEATPDKLMVDKKGLPVFPFVHYDMDKPANFVAPIHEKYAEEFCRLTDSERVSVVSRVTLDRPNRRSTTIYYGEIFGALKRRNFFPVHFPKKCDKNAWTAKDAEGVVHYEGEI